MNKELFLQILEDGLKDFPSSELNDILYDYKEHFDVGFASGKSEEYIIEELGSPYDIINQYRNGYLQKVNTNKNSKDKESTKSNGSTSENNRKRNNTIISIIIIALCMLVLGPMLLGIGLAAVTLVLGILALSLAISIGGVGVLLGKAFSNTIGFIVFPAFILDFPNSALIWLVLSSVSFMLFALIALYYVVKALIILLNKFIKWLSPKLKGGM